MLRFVQLVMLRKTDATWLYGQYTCTVHNPYGLAYLSWDVLGASLPPKPQRVSIKQLSATWVELQVDSLEGDSSSHISGYQVQYDDVSLYFVKGP